VRSFECFKQATPLELVDPEQGDTMLFRNGCCLWYDMVYIC